MAVMNAQYKHPNTSLYSQGLRDLIDSMLRSDVKQRPDIHEVRGLSGAFCSDREIYQTILLLGYHCCGTCNADSWLKACRSSPVFYLWIYVYLLKSVAIRV